MRDLEKYYGADRYMDIAPTRKNRPRGGFFEKGSYLENIIVITRPSVAALFYKNIVITFTIFLFFGET